MQIALLGSPELLDDKGATIRVASRRQRQLLLALGLHHDQTISVDVISEWLSRDQLPADPGATVQTNVSRLRRLLDAPIEISTPGGGGAGPARPPISNRGSRADAHGPDRSESGSPIESAGQMGRFDRSKTRPASPRGRTRSSGTDAIPAPCTCGSDAGQTLTRR